MAKAKYTCPNCGDPVIAARWEAGYEYCKAPTCFAALGKRIKTYEEPPDPETVDVSPYDLDEVATMYGEGD